LHEAERQLTLYLKYILLFYCARSRFFENHGIMLVGMGRYQERMRLRTPRQKR
jgi:hypothetical protein